MSIKDYFHRMRGQKQNHVKPALNELFFAFLGAFLGIFSVWHLNDVMQIQSNANLYLVGSFGASAVLIYGVPTSPFSQPRNLIGGHVLSATVGVIVHFIFPTQMALAAALAVSSAIVLQMATNTTHPPGGATALIAVTGGPSIFDLGWFYILSPVLVGALIMLGVALIVNNFSKNPTRHYPKFWF